MKNKFQSNGKGRSQRVWQLLISMLIILTMGIGQMWGDTTLLSEDFSNCNGTGGTTGTYNVSYSDLTQITSENKSTYLSADIASVDYSNSYVANGCMLNKGSSKVMTLKTVSSTSFTGGKATLSVRVAGWSGNSSASQLKVKTDNATITEVGGSQSKTNSDLTSATAPTKGAWTTYTFNITNVTANLTITIKTNYVFIDDVVLTTASSTCSEPAAPTISGEASYTEGETITLIASHEGSNHSATTTYTWYKGADWATASAAEAVQAAATGSAGYTFTKTAVTDDAGTYWCEAANSTCKSHNETGKAITVSAVADVTPPTLSSSTPANNATNIATSGNIVLTFNENVSINDASKFTLSGGTLNTAGATVSGAAVTIPYSGLTEGTEYTFSTAAGAVKDGANNTSAALSDITFTTVKCAVSSCGNASLTYSINASTSVTNTAANLLSNAVASNTTALGIGSTAALSTISISSSSNAGKAAATTSACFAEKPTMSSKIGMYNGSSYSPTNYLQFSFTVNTGYTFTPCDIQFVVQPVSATGYFRWEVTDGTTSYGHGTGEAGVGSSAGATVLTGLTSTSEMSAGTYYIRLYPYYNGSNTFRISNDVILRGTTAAAVVTSYDIAYTTPSNGSYTIQVGEAAAVSTNTTANNGQTVTLAATPSSGYKFSAWDVYKTGESTTKVSVSNNTFTMPAYDVTVSAAFAAIPTVGDLVTISDDWTFTPSATIAAGTLAESNKLFASGANDCDISGGKMRIKENRALAFKLNSGAKVKVTFTTNGDLEMKLGTAMTGDDSQVYGHSKSSPVTFNVNADGVVYLTATNQLYMSKMEIMYPHTVTYDLGDGTGTQPTEVSHYKGEQFNVHDGETGISAPDSKEFSAWNDGTSNYAAGAQYTMGSSNVTLTAQWITALPAPTITFNDGNYTIAGAALNLSTLFSSNSDGAVTYTVKTAGETGATIAGTSFTATAAGSAVVTASQAATASYKAKSVDATITISAPSEVDGIKLVEAGALTGNFRTSASLSSTAHTVAGIAYPKYIGLSARTSWSSQPSGPDNYLLQYTLTKKTNKFYFYAYNTNGGVQNVKVYVKEEGENCTTTNVPVSANSGELVSCDVNVSKNAEVCISVSATSLHICQVVVVESGDDQLVAPAVNYNINFNKGRLTAKSGTAKTFEGITYCNNADYKIDNSTYLKLTTRGTHYVSFEIPTGQTRKLQVTTGGSAYNVSKTLGDNTTATKTGNHDFNLGAGVWYINPQGSDVTITNLKFIAADAAITVAFNSNGGSDVESQALFAGDVVTAPSPAPTKDGYRLLKWQKGGADYDFDTELVAGDAPGFTLDAVWQKVWTVTFDSDGGSDVAAATVDNGQAVAQPANPTKGGYDFVEWRKEGESVAYNFATAVTEDITLVATWEVAQDDASLSALSYNGNVIDVNSAVDVSGVQTYTVHLPWGSSINAALISVTKNAQTATLSDIVYDSENKRATFMVTSGNHTVSINYAIQFVIDAKVGTSIVKAVISGGDQKAGFDATGIYGDKGYGYTRSNKKLDTADKYVGVKLLAGKTFAAGDKLFVVTSTDADRGYIEIYEEAEGTNLIKATGVRDASEGIEVAELAGYSEFYIVRKETDGDQAWNGTVDYVEVTREMAPVIKSFKFGDDAATINEGAKTITIEMPYSTDVTALTPTIEAYGNNGATYTPSGATDFTSPVDYVVTDAYGELSTTYAVTVSKAAPSENANLASLAVAGYSLDFDPATTSYNVVLDYGTTVLPTITYEVAEVGIATANKVEGGVNGATTITVTPEAGAGYEKVYTINFSVSTTQKIVIYDGTTDMNFVAESDSYLVTWESVGTDGSKQNSGATINGKDYAHNIKVFGGATSSSRTMDITIPENYVAKFYLAACSNSDSEVDIYITKDAVGAKADAVVSVTGDRTHPTWSQSDYLLPGHYFLNATNSTRLYELSIKLYPIDKQRTLTPGMLATVCLPNSGVMLGASIFEVAYYDVDSKKIFFYEVEGGVMEAGMPYIVLANEGSTQFAVKYTGSENAAAQTHHGLAGWLGAEKSLAENEYFIYDNKYYYVNAADAASGRVRITAEHAYIPNIADVPGYGGTPYPAPAPGRRRVALDAQGTQVATGIEGVEATEITVQKVLINGQMYILRGEQMYDATGRLVK